MPAPLGLPRSAWEANRLVGTLPLRMDTRTRLVRTRVGVIQMRYPRDQRSLVEWHPDGSIVILGGAMSRGCLDRIEAILPDDWSLMRPRRLRNGRRTYPRVAYREAYTCNLGNPLTLRPDGGIAFGRFGSSWLSRASLDAEVRSIEGRELEPIRRRNALGQFAHAYAATPRNVTLRGMDRVTYVTASGERVERVLPHRPLIATFWRPLSAREGRPMPLLMSATCATLDCSNAVTGGYTYCDDCNGVTEPSCDFCGEGMDDEPGVENDWNGETGCHLSCEAHARSIELRNRMAATLTSGAPLTFEEDD